jgi:hypothetical protein
MDRAVEVAVFGAVQNLILVFDRLKVILEFLKQMYTTLSNLLCIFAPGTAWE